jgi:hypothetical protein
MDLTRLPPDEAEIESEWADRWHSKFGIRHEVSATLRAWQSTCRRVARGYGDAGVDDYCYELVARDALEEIMWTPLRRRIRSALEEADRIFRDATMEWSPSPLAEYRSDIGSGWWWSRVPKTGFLADYLQEAHRKGGQERCADRG